MINGLSSLELEVKSNIVLCVLITRTYNVAIRTDRSRSNSQSGIRTYQSYMVIIPEANKKGIQNWDAAHSFAALAGLGYSPLLKKALLKKALLKT